MKPFRVVAVIAAYNEEDIVSQVVSALVADGVDVHFIDNWSTDRTYAEAAKWKDRGLVGLERFPARKCRDEYRWQEILRHKERLTAGIEADWFIHCDADEFRESPWPDMTLHDAFRFVDSLGYNAVNFELLDFLPATSTERTEYPIPDVRQALNLYRPGSAFNRVQVKAWKKQAVPVDLHSSGGHHARFPSQRIFPLPFILRHYPLRGMAHAEKKIFQERKGRFIPEEKKRGWHKQYDQFNDRSDLESFCQQQGVPFDPVAYRLDYFGRYSREMLYLLSRHGAACGLTSASLPGALEGLIRSERRRSRRLPGSIWRDLYSVEQTVKRGTVDSKKRLRMDIHDLYLLGKFYLDYEWLNGDPVSREKAELSLRLLKSFVSILVSLKQYVLARSLTLQARRHARLDDSGRVDLHMQAMEVMVRAKQHLPARFRAELDRLVAKASPLPDRLSYRYASLLEEQKRYVAAAGLFQRISDSETATVGLRGGACYHLARMDYLARNLKDAGHYVRRCLQLIPEHKKAGRLLKRIDQRRIAG